MFWTGPKLDKADPDLVDTLRSAKGDEVVRSVFLLGRDMEPAGPAPRRTAEPSVAHGSRRARIQALRERAAATWEPTVNAIRAMGLRVEGGDHSPVVVVEGPAREVIRSLRLSGVEHARLDRPMDMIARNRDLY